MPELCRFLGIVIAMYYRDHEPPHFHANYGEYGITVTIQDGVVEGKFPRRALRHVLEWYELHKEELHDNWMRARRREPLVRIDPLEQAMIVRVTDAKLVREFVIWVRFNDGSEGEVDLTAELDGPVFEPLKDPRVFAKFTLDPDTHTLVWPNGADLAPEFLYRHARVPA